MSDQDKKKAATATPESQTTAAVAPAPPIPKKLPLFRVILHNDDDNFVDHVVETILQLTPLDLNDAVQKTIEAHRSGCSLILVTHRERAELYEEQFRSRSLVVTLEPDD